MNAVLFQISWLLALTVKLVAMAAGYREGAKAA